MIIYNKLKNGGDHMIDVWSSDLEAAIREAQENR